MSAYEEIMEIFNNEPNKEFTSTDLQKRTLLSIPAIRQSLRIAKETGKVDRINWSPATYKLSSVGQAAFSDNLSTPYIIDEGFIQQIGKYVNNSTTMPGGPNGKIATVIGLYKDISNDPAKLKSLVKVLKHLIIYIERHLETKEDVDVFGF